MKLFRILSWSLLALALIFRLAHFPGAALLSIISCFLLLLHTIIFSAKNHKTNLPDSLMHATFTSWTLYLLFRIQYWPYTGHLFTVACLFTIAWLILHFSKNEKIRASQIVLVIFVAASLVIAFTPTYRIYYFFNLNSTLYSDSRHYDYRAWDKYSWFLYVSGKQEEALEANRQAQVAANECIQWPDQEDAVTYSKVITVHGQLMQAGLWASYP
ncbi:MAG TPA: hypothetical protein VK826_10670 [Bacteroidia bacterium]|nr:hypothetical protein [Bacteroidia bacterium]